MALVLKVYLEQILDKGIQKLSTIKILIIKEYIYYIINPQCTASYHNKINPYCHHYQNF